MTAEEITRGIFEGKTIAVVGNAPTAGASPGGIDGYDYVIRFNQYRTGAGFPEVGRKTNVIAIPTACLRAYPDREDLEKVSIFIDAAPAKSGDYEEGLRLIQEASPQATIIKTPEGFHKKLHKELGKVRATSGLVTVAWLLEHAHAKKVYLTGFSCQRSGKGHYFEDSGGRFDYTLHCPVKEGFWFANHQKRLSWDDHMKKILESGQPCDEVANAEKRRWKDYSEPHQRVYRIISKKLEKGSRILEIGGGIGWGAEKLKEAGMVIGTVIEPHQKSRNHLQANGWDTVSTIDEVKGMYDAATCVEVLEHLPAVEVHQFLKDIKEAAPRAFFSTPDRRWSNHGRRTELEWRTALSLAGWHVISVKKIEWTLLIEAVAN